MDDSFFYHTARIWDAATGASLAELKGHDDYVYSAAFIVTASHDRTARVWDISALGKGDAFAIACARLGNNTDLRDLAERYVLCRRSPVEIETIKV
jgi:WD40 repeat protein